MTKRNGVLFLVLLFSMFFVAGCAYGKNSANWDKILKPRTAVLVTEAVSLDGLRIGGRGKIAWTWLDRRLSSVLNKDRSVDEDVETGLQYFMSSDSDTQKKLKGRDVFVITYRALKRWDVKVEEIVINGYRLSENDILTIPINRLLGELPPDEEGILHVAVPSLPKKGKIELAYGDETVEWQIPR